MLSRRSLQDKDLLQFREQLDESDIDLSYNCLTFNDTEWLKFIINASYLNLSDNRIKILSLSPPSPFLNLKYLNLSHNQITHIDNDVFPSLPNLKVLRLEGNQMPDLPSSIGNLNKLGILILGNILGANPIKTLPLKMKNMRELRVLECAGCKLDLFPSLLLNLPLLEVLNLSGNLINKLPSNIRWNSSLVRIDLSRNILCELPNDIAWPSGLKFIDFTFNQIEYVGRRTFQTLPSECSLLMAGNPCISPNNIPTKQLFVGTEISLLNNAISELNLNDCCFTQCIRRRMQGREICSDCPVRYRRPGGRKWCIDRVGGHEKVLVKETVCSCKCLNVREGEQVILSNLDLELED